VLSLVGGLIAMLWIDGMREVTEGPGPAGDNAIVGVALILGVLMCAHGILWLCSAVFLAYGFARASTAWKWIAGVALAGSGLPLLGVLLRQL
jgi:hypothetical protein